MVVPLLPPFQVMRVIEAIEEQYWHRHRPDASNGEDDNGNSTH